MSAHLRSIVRPCRCGRPATVELFNTFNASCGDFCRSCGKRELAAALKREKAEWDRGVRNDGRVHL